MHRSNDRIRSLSIEYVDSHVDLEAGMLVIEKFVSDPHDEIIPVETEYKRRILIAYTEQKRRIVQFQLFDDGKSHENHITLWDLMTTLEIRCGHRSLIVALKKNELNIIYVIEMERGFLLCSDDFLEEENDLYIKPVEEITVATQESVAEIEIGDHIVTEKKNSTEKSTREKNKNTNTNNVSKKKISVTEDKSKSQKIASFIVDGVVTYTFYMSDYRCLAQGEWLNDLIIDWYLMYLYSKVISHSDRERTFIYSSLFFAVLRQEATKATTVSSDSNHRFDKMQTFTAKVNIFDKDFVIIPVNEYESHWYLIIICFLGLVEDQEIDDASQSLSSLSLTNDDDKSKKKCPCILVFDSLKNYKKINDIKLLRDYLSFQYNKCYHENKLFSESYLSCDYPSVPKQKNFADCGIFVLQYVESFFKNPIKNFSLPIKSLENWFPYKVVRKKRALLASILRKMSRETEGLTRSISFPKLRFGDEN